MNETTIGIIGTISTILFAYLAFRKGEHKSLKNEAKSEGVLISDIGYIKSSIDRMEKKFDLVDEKYQNAIVRIVRLEQAMNIKKGD